MSQQDLDLSTIPGLGPVRRKALEAAGINDLQGLLALKVAELAEIRGIGLWQARKIREFLRQRGLLADEEDSSSGVIHVHPPHTPAEVQAVAAAAQALEQQAEREAATEAEVARLAEVVAEAMHTSEGDGAEPDPERALLQEQGEVIQQASPAKEADVSSRNGKGSERAPERDAEEEHGVSRNELAAQRERLPETATALMEAIREAAISRRLPRQITRFLVTASEFLDDSHPVTDEHRTIAREAMIAVDALMNRAIERRRFRPDDQDELADRVRKYRKHLERVLAEVEADTE